MKILIITNHSYMLYRFRWELIAELQKADAVDGVLCGAVFHSLHVCHRSGLRTDANGCGSGDSHTGTVQRAEKHRPENEPHYEVGVLPLLPAAPWNHRLAAVCLLNSGKKTATDDQPCRFPL